MFTFLSIMFKVLFFAAKVALFVPGVLLKLAFSNGKPKAHHEKKSCCQKSFLLKLLLGFALCTIISVIVTKLVKRLFGEDDEDDYDFDADECCPNDPDCCKEEDSCDEECCEKDCTDDDCDCHGTHHHKHFLKGKKHGRHTHHGLFGGFHHDKGHR